MSLFSPPQDALTNFPRPSAAAGPTQAPAAAPATMPLSEPAPLAPPAPAAGVKRPLAATLPMSPVGAVGCLSAFTSAHHHHHAAQHAMARKRAKLAAAAVSGGEVKHDSLLLSPPPSPLAYRPESTSPAIAANSTGASMEDEPLAASRAGAGLAEEKPLFSLEERAELSNLRSVIDLGTPVFKDTAVARYLHDPAGTYRMELRFLARIDNAHASRDRMAKSLHHTHKLLGPSGRRVAASSEPGHHTFTPTISVDRPARTRTAPLAYSPTVTPASESRKQASARKPGAGGSSGGSAHAATGRSRAAPVRKTDKPVYSNSHKDSVHGLDVASMAYDRLPDYMPTWQDLDRVTHPKGLRTEWKGPALDLAATSTPEQMAKMHPAEINLASVLRLPVDMYLDSKKRIFAEWHLRTKQGRTFRKTDCQRVCRVDVNKASRLWEVYSREGFFNREVD